MKKKYLTWAGIIAAAALAVLFTVIVLTGTFTPFPSASIDPVPDYAAGDLVVFTGTTSLPAGQRLELDIVPAAPGSGNRSPAGSTDAFIVHGTGLANRWSGALDTAGIPAGEYRVDAYPLDTSDLSYTKGSLLATARFVLYVNASAEQGIPAAVSGQPGFIAIVPPAPVFRGDKLLVSGTTDLPAGTDLLYSVIQQSNTSVFTIDPATGRQDTRGGFTRSGLVSVLSGSGGTNTWSFALDTTEFIPDRYQVLVIPVQENQTPGGNDVGTINGSAYLVVREVPATGGA